ELRRSVENGNSPSSFTARLRLSKSAKLLFDSAKVDGKKLSTLDRIELVRAQFSYETYLKKLELRWDQGIRNVDGPRRDPKALMALGDTEARPENFRSVWQWSDSYFNHIETALVCLGCPLHKQIFHTGSSLA